MTLKAIVATAIKPGNFLVMAKKVLKRVRDPTGALSYDENLQWIRANLSDFSEIAIAIDKALWDEALAYNLVLEQRARDMAIPDDLAGSGFYPMLYFITRLRRPAVIVETGVAAGYTAHACLSAMEKNGTGHLFSSDFPLFRMTDPEKVIGMLVEPHMRARWTLSIDGDERALPRIARAVTKIDLFHYDSDKSYSGRRFAMRALASCLGPDSIIVMDDIQDNAYFYELAQKRSDWRIFEWGRKYVGLLGTL